MTYERLDPSLLPVLADAPSLTAERLRARCDDPFARPLVDDWLREAFDRGLVNVRRHADLPSEWRLTPKGRKTARRLG
jgi:hypothetical protein